MLRSALLRHSIATVTAATLLAGIGPLATTATAADAPGVVFPGAVAQQPRTVVPLAAGATGYLRYDQGRGHFWSSYAGDYSTPLTVEEEGPEADGRYGAGIDGYAMFSPDWTSTSHLVRVVDKMVGGKTAHFYIPKTHRYVGAYGTTVVTFTQATVSSPRVWHLLRLVNGALQDTPITGWPAGALPPAHPIAGTADGVLTTYEVAGATRTAWIDLASGQVRPLPEDAAGQPVSTVIGPNEIVAWAKDGKARFYAKGEAGASGPLTPTATTELPHSEGDALLGLVGDRLIVGRVSGQGSTAPYRVVSVPRAGGEETTLFAHGRAQVLATPDGGLLLVAGASGDALSLQRLTVDGDGTASAKLVDVTPVTSKPRKLTFSHGQLDSLERKPDETNTFLSRTVSVTGALTGGPTQDRGTFGFDLSGCTDENICQDNLPTGDGRLVAQGDFGGVPVVVEEGATSGRPVTTELTNVQVQDVSGRYAFVGGYTESGDWVTSTVDLDTGKRLATLNVPSFNWDLQGDTLWASGSVAGTVLGYDVRTGAVKRTVDLGSGCRAESIKVTARWLSWDCAGQVPKGGVHDLDTNVNKTLTEPFSQLGDGYVVRQNGRDVTVTDFRGPAPVLKATYQVSEDNFEHGPWAVDTATGRLAFQDNAAGDIRVVDLGVPASPLAKIDADVPATQAVNGGKAPWKPRWWLTKPAASWSLSLKSDSTGSVVRTLSGGEARGVVKPAWDGKGTDGKLVADGAYTWTLTAKPADGQGADLVLTGGVKLTGSVPAWRDMAGDDRFGDLLVMDSVGLVSLYKGNGSGGVSARVAGTGAKFPTTAVPVPAGDLNGDGCNDVYVRVGDELRAYRPGCGVIVSASSPYTSVGKGWGQYDVLTSSGDVNGDGFKDLIARQASTGDMYFYPGTTDHRLGARVKIGTNWKLYGKIVGAGDLNGDGRGDLLGMDASGVLWRYYGTANGGVTARVKVGAGWGGYSSLVGVGDITGDGRSELLARDTTGKLWRYTNLGNGLYAGRVMIGTAGWNAFKGLY
ncbi:FG-GAP-like repeat-containing protein [Streptomyces sp. NPDC014870]|uniref:FG-GAP-like repeat-containing protein n=1 Tax=Streptomyces sp. NPDC014870 TaxID=3364925 RepID=UPI0036F50A74